VFPYVSPSYKLTIAGPVWFHKCWHVLAAMVQEGPTASVEHLRAGVEALNSNFAAPSTSGRSTSKQHGGGHQSPNACKDMSMENARTLVQRHTIHAGLYPFPLAFSSTACAAGQ
jgi:hypothetical protein